MRGVVVGRRRSWAVGLVGATAAVIGLLVAPGARAAGGSGVISGATFQDGNRNGVQDAGEAPLSGQQLYLFDSTGQTDFGTTTSDSGGRYSFRGLSAGTYRVEDANGAWMSLRDNWVPTT